ncbi:MAG: IS1595 family transposase [Bacteroidetes bacterium]|nr:IS1595 family transposase [Bacteroidota bacterium]
MINIDIKSIPQLLKAFHSEQICIEHLEKLRWNGNVISPFDETSKVYKCAGNKYRCKNTGKYFNVRTGTLFDNTKIELQKWFLAIYIVTSHKKGISSLQLAKDIDVTQKTAWFMLQRIRNCFGIENPHSGNGGSLDNEVEIDEAFVGGKNKNRHKSKKVENSQGRSYKDKTPVLGMVERGGKLAAKTIENTQAETLTPEIVAAVKQTANIYTDEWLGYKDIKWIYDHAFVKHNSHEYVNGRVHTNTIEGFWSLLKRGIFGIYHSTSKKHLQKYVDEFVFRYNTRSSSESGRFNQLLSNSENRLTYKNLIK